MKSCLTLPAGDVRRELQQTHRAWILCEIAHGERCPDILERGVDSVNEQLHHDRLMRTGQDQARSAARNEIARGFGDPLIVKGRPLLDGGTVVRMADKPASVVASAILRASAKVKAGI